jgi:tetratricopeptide (TPR) repeat protein
VPALYDTDRARLVTEAPAVKGRKVFGGLVPFGQLWRAGANENTTVRFAGPVMVEGQALAAGTYGLHMIPGHDSWSIIFSHNATSWGSYFYDSAEDALRVTVEARKAPMQEWMSYEFQELTKTGGALTLRWAELAVPVRIEVDPTASVLAEIRDNYLRGLAGFNPESFASAAAWCLANDVNHEEALGWCERSFRSGESFTKHWTKAGLLQALGRSEYEVGQTRDKALKLATEAEVNAMGYQFLVQGSTDQAIDLFERNVAEHPDSWNVHDSLAEALAAAGRVSEARESYGRALSMADHTNQDRIRSVLESL